MCITCCSIFIQVTELMWSLSHRGEADVNKMGMNVKQQSSDIFILTEEFGLRNHYHINWAEYPYNYRPMNMCLIQVGGANLGSLDQNSCV